MITRKKKKAVKMLNAYLSSFVKLYADNPENQTGQRNDGHDSNDVDGCGGCLVFLVRIVPVTSTATAGVVIPVLLKIVVECFG